MIGNHRESTPDRIVLHSDLSEISRVFRWIEVLASRYEIVESVQFAINLCLEEAVSNVIRHGYAGQPGRPIAVCFSISGEGAYIFTVDDEAPPFNPLETPSLPMLDEQGEARIGGHGILLIRGFADALEYKPVQGGNRLCLVFSKGASPHDPQ
jgi:anti-sigma regulatory factor (Ser/Thr protein kinase)